MSQGINYMTVLLCPMCMAPVEPQVKECPYCKAPFAHDNTKPIEATFSEQNPLYLLLFNCLKHYFDLNELVTMCFVLRIDSDDIFPSGTGKTVGCKKLIEHMANTGSITRLYAYIKKERPHLELK